MKKNRSLLILVPGITAVIIAMFALLLFYSSEKYSQSSNLGNHGITNKQLQSSPVANVGASKETTNALIRTSEANNAGHQSMQRVRTRSANVQGGAKTSGEFFKTMTDLESGEYAVVNSDKEVVTLKNRNGDIMWSAKIVGTLGTVPTVSEKKINSMRLVGDKLIVTIGKDYFSINKQSGEVKYLGAN